MSMMTRRTFAATAAAIPIALRAQTAQARIKIDPDRTVGEIDPKLYGNFAEHLGRCIYGGIYEPGSKLSDRQGYRKDVLKAAQDLGVTTLRWPGGNFSSNYNWMDGIGAKNERPARLEMAWGTTETNQFGTHEFLNYCELGGFEPYLCANYGTGSWVEAQRWVEYCNSSQETAMTRLRAKNGREKPWKVTYWGLGNEMDGPWQMGHRDADDYGKFALEGAKMMKWTDPSIKLVAAGSSNFAANADWTAWNRVVLQHLKDHVEYLSLHTYVGNRDQDYYEYLTSSQTIDHRIKTAEGTIDEVLEKDPKRKISIAYDEWNVWYRARGGEGGKPPHQLEERYNLEDALVVATMLNSFVNHAHVVKMANLAQLVNVIAPIFSNENGIYLQTTYYPLAAFAKNTRGTALEVFVESPGYSSKQFGQTPYLDVSAARNGGALVLNVVNRHKEQALEAEIEAEDARFEGEYACTEINGPDIKAENDFGASPVKPVLKSVTGSGNKMRYLFPAHSYTMIQGKLP